MKKRNDLSTKKFCVYALVNSLDNNVFYIGKGKKYRPTHHQLHARRGSEYYVHRKIRKILSLGGRVDIELLLETDDEQEALNKEVEMIAFYGRENLTNLTDGGEGSSGFKHSQESKEKLRQQKIGKKLTPESITRRQQTRKERQIPAWNKGMKMSPEFCEKVGRSGLGKEPWNKGKKIPQWIKDKISARQKEIGRPMSEYNKEQLRKALKGVPKTEEMRKKLSLAKSKPVRCIETGEVFQNSIIAGKHYGVSHAAIRQAIKKNGKCCGFHWEKL